MFFFLWQILSFQCSLALSKNSSHACSFAPRGSLSILLNFSLDVLLITVAVNSRRRNKLWSFKKLLRFTRVYNRRMLDDRLVYMIWRLLWKHGGEKLHLPIYLSTTVFIIQRVNSFIKFKSSFVKLPSYSHCSSWRRVYAHWISNCSWYNIAQRRRHSFLKKLFVCKLFVNQDVKMGSLESTKLLATSRAILTLLVFSVIIEWSSEWNKKDWLTFAYIQQR